MKKPPSIKSNPDLFLCRWENLLFYTLHLLNIQKQKTNWFSQIVQNIRYKVIYILVFEFRIQWLYKSQRQSLHWSTAKCSNSSSSKTKGSWCCFIVYLLLIIIYMILPFFSYYQLFFLIEIFLSRLTVVQIIHRSSFECENGLHLFLR